MNAKYREVDGVRLRQFREARAYSIRELERLSGISRDTIYNVENNRRGAHPRTVRKLAEALGVEPPELMKGVEDG